jgi:histidinol-phosphate/aromatic aminotransferase/cobyric acid decarboxylase-like protein
VLKANDDAIIVMDNAYRGCSEVAGLARYAVSNPRVMYLNTASKDLYLCGARFGWVIASQPLIDVISASLPPYGVGKDALTSGLEVLSRPTALRSARATQAFARDILDRGLRRLGLKVHGGTGPWVLARLEDEAARVVKVMAEAFLIEVQLQTASLDGWIRVSATVPCEANRIVAAFSRILGTTAADHRFCCEDDLQSVVENSSVEQKFLRSPQHAFT